MSSYINSLFDKHNIKIEPHQLTVFQSFVESDETKEAVALIELTNHKIMANWNYMNKLEEIKNKKTNLPNGTVGKPYSAKFDFNLLIQTGFESIGFEGLSEIGLSYNPETLSIEGVPSQSGNLAFYWLFKQADGIDSQIHKKPIPLIINPDPKSLWKNIPSDPNAPYWKKDEESDQASLGDRYLVASSKRGRSHQNVGSFRDDGFAYKHFNKTGWSVVAMSDGAGSSTLSRKGSELACQSVIDYFENHLDIAKEIEFEEKVNAYKQALSQSPVDGPECEKIKKQIEVIAKQSLYQATVFVHNQIKAEAQKAFEGHPELFNNPKAKSYIDYFHATLIFVLFKKYPFGYMFLTFSVGDCPMAIINQDKSQTTLLNWLDVGEYGGGTRFITQPEIFHSTSQPMSTRFGMTILQDFSYLFLMTDGVYDPKFSVEANLEKHEKWLELLEDLQGNNPENQKVELNNQNPDQAQQLSAWLDFWSPGNHDDRTLAIIM